MDLNARVKERREKLFGSDGGQARVGLALSGGGIRSATFCLGLLRALAANKVLHCVDLMSTVSGGGYAGAMLGRLLSRARNEMDVFDIYAALGAKSTPWFLWWLRANGRYLVPRGAKDTVYAAAMYVRNMVAVHVEIALLALLLGVACAAFNAFAWGYFASQGYVDGSYVVTLLAHWPHTLPTVSFLLVIPLAFAALFVAIYWWVPPASKEATSTVRRYLVVMLLLGIAGYLLWRFVPLNIWQVVVRIDEAWRTNLLRFCVSFGALVLLGALGAFAAVWLPKEQIEKEFWAGKVRVWLTRALAFCMWGAGGIVLVGILDRTAWYIAFELEATASVGAALAALLAIGRALMPSPAALQGNSAPTKLLIPLGRVLGYALIIVLCAWWMAIVYRVGLAVAFWRVGPDFETALRTLLLMALVLLAYVVVTGGNLHFLNLSSLHALYRARLTRSYLGACNPRRFQTVAPFDPLGSTKPVPPGQLKAPTDTGVADAVEDDDVALSEYSPHAVGGPIHLINVCLNETTDPRGKLFNQDRRGRLLTVMGGKNADCAWSDVSTPVRRAGDLSLGTWTAISGAAVAPGLGPLTRGGISALMMLFGVRLGFWWTSFARHGAKLPWSPWPHKSAALIRETFGAFSADEEADWYLTDGGHFENTGAYVLLAQRCPLIIVADCGADPSFRFNDLENLVRKARIDLQADIEFCRPRTDLRPGFPERPGFLSDFGSLQDLASPTGTACLAMARIHYQKDGGPTTSGVMLVVKPNLCEGVPVDLQNFKGMNPDFPQQSTADQFFSEAQWESYFQLGQYIGEKVQPEALMSILLNQAAFFEPDMVLQSRTMASSSETRAATATAAPDGQPTRVPLRWASSAKSTLSMTAAATVAVTAWQALEGIRTTQVKTRDAERAALGQITEALGKLKSVPSQSSDEASALAASLLKAADTLCEAGEQGWFVRSAAAREAYGVAVEACRKAFDRHDDRSPACRMLLEADHPALLRPLPGCLASRSDPVRFDQPLRYGYYDYGPTAKPLHAHPCDQRILRFARKEDQLGRKEFRFELDSGGDDDRFPTPDVNECLDSAPSPESPVSQANAASIASPASGAEGQGNLNACAGVTVYVQRYGPTNREVALKVSEDWAHGLSARVAPIEDVLASARFEGRLRPLGVEKPRIVHGPKTEECAKAMQERAMALVECASTWKFERKGVDRRIAGADVVEFWVPSDPMQAVQHDRPAPLAPASCTPAIEAAALVKQHELKRFEGPERRAWAMELVGRARTNQRDITSALLAAIRREDAPLSYRVNLYILYTLARLPQPWDSDPCLVKAFAELRTSSAYTGDPTFKARWREAERNKLDSDKQR